MNYVYIIQGYNKKDEQTFGLYDVVEINLEAENEDNAIKKAEGMIKKKFYRIAKVSEMVHNHANQEDMQILQLEIQKKMLDFIRGKK
mgnify:CR=1 FL=1